MANFSRMEEQNMEGVADTHYLTGCTDIAMVAGDRPCLIDDEWGSEVGWNQFSCQLHAANGLEHKAGYLRRNPHVRVDLVESASGKTLARKRSGAGGGSVPLAAPRWDEGSAKAESCITLALPSGASLEGLGLVLHVGTLNRLGGGEEIMGSSPVLSLSRLGNLPSGTGFLRLPLDLSDGGQLEVTLRYHDDAHTDTLHPDVPAAPAPAAGDFASEEGKEEDGHDTSSDSDNDNTSDSDASAQKTIVLTAKEIGLSLEDRYLGLAREKPVNDLFMTEGTGRYTLKFYLWDRPSLVGSGFGGQQPQ